MILDGVNPEDPHAEPAADQPQQVSYRRRPKLVSFLVLGAVVGLVAGGLLGFLGPAAEGSSRMQDVVLLGALAAVFGGFIGSIVYLVADRASLRSRR